MDVRGVHLRENESTVVSTGTLCINKENKIGDTVHQHLAGIPLYVRATDKAPNLLIV